MLEVAKFQENNFIKTLMWIKQYLTHKFRVQLNEFSSQKSQSTETGVLMNFSQRILNFKEFQVRKAGPRVENCLAIKAYNCYQLHL